MSIENRIRKLEGKTGVKEEEPAVVIIDVERDEATVPHFPEPVEEWWSFRDAHAEAKRTGLPLVPLCEGIRRVYRIGRTDETQQLTPALRAGRGQIVRSRSSNSDGYCPRRTGQSDSRLLSLASSAQCGTPS